MSDHERNRWTFKEVNEAYLAQKRLHKSELLGQMSVSGILRMVTERFPRGSVTLPLETRDRRFIDFNFIVQPFAPPDFYDVLDSYQNQVQAHARGVPMPQVVAVVARGVRGGFLLSEAAYSMDPTKIKEKIEEGAFRFRPLQFPNHALIDEARLSAVSRAFAIAHDLGVSPRRVDGTTVIVQDDLNNYEGLITGIDHKAMILDDKILEIRPDMIEKFTDEVRTTQAGFELRAARDMAHYLAYFVVARSQNYTPQAIRMLVHSALEDYKTQRRRFYPEVLEPNLFDRTFDLCHVRRLDYLVKRK